MAKGNRTYTRDSRGRFASGGGGGSARPRRGAATPGGTLKARVSLAKSRNKLEVNQTSAQRGAVTRAKNKLAEVRKQSLRRMPTTGQPAGVMRGKVQRRPVQIPPVMPTKVMARPERRQPGQGPMAQTMRGMLRELAQADARRIREIESITGQKVRPTAIDAKTGKAAGAAARASAAAGGSVTGAMRTALRGLAQSDARAAREMGRIVDAATPKVAGGKGRKGVTGGARPQLPGSKPAAPAAKPMGKASAPAVKPKAKKESKRNISDAKAGRIIARIDANRPGLRKASGSDRRTRNAIQTHERASAFVRAASTREIKRSGGQSRMGLLESTRRAIRNSKPKKPKPSAPAAKRKKR